MSFAVYVVAAFVRLRIDIFIKIVIPSLGTKNTRLQCNIPYNALHVYTNNIVRVLTSATETDEYGKSPSITYGNGLLFERTECRRTCTKKQRNLPDRLKSFNILLHPFYSVPEGNKIVAFLLINILHISNDVRVPTITSIVYDRLDRHGWQSTRRVR